MRKSTKGALAGAAAALLLFGGMGTRATWNDDGSIAGSAIESGHLQLVANGCGSWKIGGNDVDLSVLKIVPGSLLTKICTFTVDLDGDGLRATLTATPPAYTGSNGLTSELDTAAAYTRNGVGIGTTTELDDGDVVTATLTVELPEADATNLSQGLIATLDTITVTATQAA